MRLLFALPGFHRFDRGAEVALLAVASELAGKGQEVTVIGSGPPRPDRPYAYRQVRALRRETFERFPKVPPFRSETAWEDATFAFHLLRATKFGRYDANLTCSFPFTQWALRARKASTGAQIFVTQNGDWPAMSSDAEFRTFACDGLVCTNPDYLERNRSRWNCALIPNGVDTARFKPGPGRRAALGLPPERPVVLMVSALIESKRVLDGIRAVAALDDATLVVAGDGPLRQEVIRLGGELLPDRFRLVSLSADEMPDLYRSADVFLHLSLLESFGNVFLEAWATGLPIVGHDTPRLRWILGDAHLLCDTTRADDLKAALQAGLSRGGATCQGGVNRYAWSAIAGEYLAFIEQTVARTRRG